MKASSSSHRLKSGFTLVELLVVIGIIALLISILLPALNRARENAKRVACAAQLRQVGIATRAYAVDNKDALPPMNMDNGQPTYNIGTSVNAQRTWSFSLWGNPPSAAEKAQPTGSGIGRLIVTKYLQGNWLRMVACPSSTPQEDLAYANDPARYGYNLHWARRTVNGAEVLQPWWRKVSQYGRVPKVDLAGSWIGGTSAPSSVPNYSPNGRDLALAADPTQAPNMTNGNTGYNPHTLGNTRAYNLLYADGSVRTSIVPNKLSRNNTGSYGAMLDQLGWAESIASGAEIMEVNSTKIGSYVIIPLDPPNK